MEVEPLIYFASGANSAGEIWGLSRAGHPLGVAAPEVTGETFARKKAQEALEDVARYRLPLFVDSGAFTAFRKGTPLTAADWGRNLDLYARLARVHGDLVYVVAPDVIRDQAATLAGLERYAPELEKIADLGGRVIVPLQRGDLSLAEMHAAAGLALDTGLGRRFPRPLVWGIPSNAAAYPTGATGEVVEWVCATQPERIHLLGIGPTGAGLTETLATIGLCSPDTRVSTDSNLLRGLRGRGKRVKPLTRAQDDVRRQLEECEEVAPGASKLERAWAESAAVKLASCQRVILGRVAHHARRTAMVDMNWRGYRSGYRAASRNTSGVYVITHRGAWWTAYYGPHRRRPSDDRRRLGRATTYNQAKELAREYERALAGVSKVRDVLEERLEEAAEELAPKRDEATEWVKRKAEQFVADGKPKGAAWAIAWAIYCKYKRDEIPDTWGHCRKPPSGYLKKKARRRGARRGAKTRKRKARASRAKATTKLRARVGK